MKHFFKIFVVVGLCIGTNNGKDLEAQSIVGGMQAIRNQFKYQVALLRNNIPVCGGALLDSRFMITAAHCVLEAETGEFMSGRFTVIIAANTLFLPGTTVIRDTVKRVFVLKEFAYVRSGSGKASGFIADLAMVKLKGRLKLEDNPNLQILQIYTSLFGINLNGKSLIITGYGYSFISHFKEPLTLEPKIFGFSDRHLRFADVDIVPDSVCKGYHDYYESEKHLCAKMRQQNLQEAEGTCYGDHGNPLVLEGNVLVAVLSANSSGCYEDQEPAVYTNVAYYAEFIKNVLLRKLTPDMRTATWRKKSMFNSEKRLMEGSQTHADGENKPKKKKKDKVLKAKLICDDDILTEVPPDHRLRGEDLQPQGIVGGDAAVKNQFKYQASLLKDNVHVCGGALLDGRFMITAAHCVYNAQRRKFISGHFTVILTAINLYYIEDGVIKDSVKRVFLLAAFTYVTTDSDGSGGYEADIALVKLKGRLKLDGNLYQKTLQICNFNEDLSFDTNLTVSGYGYSKIDYTRDSKTLEYKKIGYSKRDLRYAEVEVLPDSVCMNFHQYYKPHKHLCARVRQRSVSVAEGTCDGDDGSPLVYEGDILVGILSAPSSGCYESQEPAIYINVAYYAEFIKNVLQRKLTPDMLTATWRRKSIFHTTYKLMEGIQTHADGEEVAVKKKKDINLVASSDSDPDLLQNEQAFFSTSEHLISDQPSTLISEA